jgi:hypothetical protein
MLGALSGFLFTSGIYTWAWGKMHGAARRHPTTTSVPAGSKKLEGPMPTETDYKDFKFRSSLEGMVFTKILGLTFVLISSDFWNPSWWVHPTWDQFLRFIVGFTMGLPMLALGAMLALNGCQIEVADWQFRFRRFITWEAVPLESVSSVKRTFVGTYIKIDHAGKRHRLFCHPKGEDMPRLARSPVVGFLQKVCRRNKERRSSSAGGAPMDRDGQRI